MNHTLTDYITNKKSLFWLILIILTALRINWLYITQIELYGDEAQYWLWSQSLDFGYYSKPPVLAYIIALTTTLLGNSEASVRLSSPVIHLLVSYVIYRIVRTLGYERIIGLWSAFVYITLPSVFLSSALISTDPAFMLFWSVSMLFYLKAIGNNKFRYWFAVGVFAGLGLLTKYSMAIFPISILCHLLYTKNLKKTLLNYKFWIAGLLALCLFSINLYWNFLNDFPSLHHTYDLSQGRPNEHWTIKNPLAFLVGQIGMIGPILFVAFLFAIRKADKTLLCFTLPFMLIILGVSAYSRAHANWAAPAYVCATIISVMYLFKPSRFIWLKISTILHLILGVFLMCYIAITENFEIQLSKLTDPLWRIKGNYEMTQQLLSFIEEDGYCYLAFDDRMTLSAFQYNLNGHNCNFAKWNPDGVVKDHFDMTTDMNDFKGENIYFITKGINLDYLKEYGKRAYYVTTLFYHPYNGHKKYLDVYKIKKFKGY